MVVSGGKTVVESGRGAEPREAALPPARALAERLRALRLDGGLTQEQLAERAELHPGYIQKLEAGERLPSLPALLRLARALGARVTDLVAVLDDVLDDLPPADRDPGDDDALAALLRRCTPRQRALVRDFLRLLLEHGC